MRTSPWSATRAAAATPSGIPNVRTKSPPVPRGISASSGALLNPTRPFADLVEGSVAPDDDEQLDTVERCSARELGEVTRCSLNRASPTRPAAAA